MYICICVCVYVYMYMYMCMYMCIYIYIHFYIYVYVYVYVCVYVCIYIYIYAYIYMYYPHIYAAQTYISFTSHPSAFTVKAEGCMFTQRVPCPRVTTLGVLLLFANMPIDKLCRAGPYQLDGDPPLVHVCIHAYTRA